MSNFDPLFFRLLVEILHTHTLYWAVKINNNCDPFFQAPGREFLGKWAGRAYPP